MSANFGEYADNIKLRNLRAFHEQGIMNKNNSKIYYIDRNHKTN